MAEATAGDAGVRPYRWLLIGALVLCSTSMLWYGFTIGVLLPDISDDLGLRPAQEGWLSSSFYFGQLVLTLPVTAWLSRYQPLRTMGFVYVGAIVLLAAAAVTPWYWVQVGIRFVLAFAFVALNPVRTLIIAGWFRRDEVARVNSVFNSGFGVVQTVAFWSTGALLGVLGGWREVLWMLVGVATLSSVAWFVVAARAPRPAYALPSGGAEDSNGGGMGRVLRRKQVWFLCLIGIGGALTWATYLTFWPSFAQDEMGVSKSVTGIVLGVSALTIIPGSLAAVWVMRLMRSRRLFLVVATASQVPLFGLWALVDQPVLLVIIGLVQGFSWIYFPIMLSIPFDFEGFDARDIALASAFFIVANSLALTLGPAVSGVVAEQVEMRTVLLVAAIMPLISVLGAVLLADPPPGPMREVGGTETALASAS
ncbi:MAG: MFS transporter [Dehalococcoidia bacterium]|nr:MFS transporter [Dehalococcoidia bacterium]HRC62512.1 MFS transporter [Dehalococcoidia bacterium]